MSGTLTEPIFYILGAMLAAALLFFLAALWQLRIARTSPYWLRRKSSGQRGGQLFLVALVLFLLAGGASILTGAAQVALGDLLAVPPTATATAPPPTDTPQPTPDIEATVAAALTGTALSQPDPSPTPPPPSATHTITATASPTAVPVFTLTPPASALEPRAGAVLEVLGVSAGPEETPSTEAFTAGLRRLYVHYRWRNMDAGVTWTRLLLADGQAVQGGVYRWSGVAQGEGLFFFGREDGYPPGLYEVRLYLGQEETGRYSFSIISGDGG